MRDQDQRRVKILTPYNDARICDIHRLRSRQYYVLEKTRLLWLTNASMRATTTSKINADSTYISHVSTDNLPC